MQVRMRSSGLIVIALTVVLAGSAAAQDATPGADSVRAETGAPAAGTQVPASPAG